MCGILGYIGSQQDAPQKVLTGLKLLEYRGYDSWGVAALSPKTHQSVIEKYVGKIGSASLQEIEVSSLAIGHTRWATHGGVTAVNAHPHTDCEGRYVLVHNGIVENYQELRASLEKLSHIFVSQTDSEVIVHLIEELAKTHSFEESVRHAFLQLHGLNAIAVMDTQTQELISVRHGSPLVLGKDATGWYVASDASALAQYTKDVYYMRDQEMAVFSLTSGKLINVTTGAELPLTFEHLTFSFEDLDKGTYEHFMKKEIYEQPRVLSAVLDRTAVVHEFAKALQKKEAWFVGCGTAYYAGFIGSYLLNSVAKMPSHVYAASEFGTQMDLYDPKKHFVTFVSQSGETIDIVEFAGMLKKQGLPFGAIVNRLGSTLERMASNKVVLPAGPEQCVLATKSFTAKFAVFLLLAHHLAGKDKQGEIQLSKAITSLAEVLTDTFEAEHIHPVAKELAQHQDIFLIGRGVSYPLALEAALKIKEVTYLHAEGFAGGELKHGSIALIEKGTPCIVLAPKDETYEAIISNAMELKSRGATIIGVSPTNNSVFDMWIPVADCKEATVIPMIVAFQLVAYHMAILLERDPDKPRNLAKSVTVK